jgi:hypothetical protein
VTARFTSNLAILIIGASLASARFAFDADTVRWIAFGSGAGALIIVAAAFLTYGRGPVQRALDAVAALIAGWTTVSALTFATPVVGWLAVGEGGALAWLAAVGLIAHETLMERAVWPA